MIIPVLCHYKESDLENLTNMRDEVALIIKKN